MATDPQLQKILDQLKELSGMAEGAAEEAAPIVQKALERSIAAGTTPEGEPWHPRADGSRPLVNAAQALHVVAYQGTVFVRLTGPEARHHKGAVKGGKRRPILPASKEVPKSMAAPIAAALNAQFERRATSG